MKVIFYIAMIIAVSATRVRYLAFIDPDNDDFPERCLYDVLCIEHLVHFQRCFDEFPKEDQERILENFGKRYGLNETSVYDYVERVCEETDRKFGRKVLYSLYEDVEKEWSTDAGIWVNLCLAYIEEICSPALESTEAES